MPGRVSTRASQSATMPSSPRKSSSTSRSRASTARNSDTAIPQEGPDNTLRTQVIAVFGDAQRTTASHRKLAISLRKIQEACCYEPPAKSKNSAAPQQFEESDFNAEVMRCVVRICSVKKSEPVGDRVVRFLGLFLRFSAEKDNELVPEESRVDDMFQETPASRLISQILGLLLPLLTSKEKVTRYRATQIISYIVNSVDAIDDDVFQQLRQGLLRRVHDKESMVRVQAVLGLGRLAGNEDQEIEDEDDEDGLLLDKLLEVLQNDPSADVRRSLLLNLPITPETLPYLLERARDLDPATRRALYSRLLPALGDFRHLSLSMREKILRWGLRDRDESVRKAAGKLFRERWIEDCNNVRKEDAKPGELSAPNVDALLELLERVDIVNSGVEKGVAGDAMKGFWEGRPDYREAIVFDDAFWDNLSTESVFLARSFNDFCRQADGKYDSLMEEKMPEVTKLAFYLQKYINQLVAAIQRVEETQEDLEDEEVIDLEFIVEQLLRIALTLDYSDEVGRRKTFSLMRETLAISKLPEEVTALVVDVLRILCGSDAAGDREFCGIVLEAVAEVHDTIASADDVDESFHSAQSEPDQDLLLHNRAAKISLDDNLTSKPADDSEESVRKAILEIMVNMKCLHIAQCMLENVDGNLKDNVHLVTMLNNLVIPAVRSHEAPIRERGLRCLGLCCLLDKGLAEENLALFVHCFNKGHDTLQVEAIHIISDMLTAHGSALLTGPSCQVDEKMLYKMFTKGLKADDKIDVQSAACEAVCKLKLSQVIRDEELLKSLVVAYFDPGTADNLALRQSLTYFLSVYCHSRAKNQELMAAVFVSVLHAIILLHDNMDEEEEMVTPLIVANHLVDWTDPRKVVDLTSIAVEAMWDENGRKETTPKPVESEIHADLALELLERITGSSSKEEKKVFASTMGKLYIPSSTSSDKLRTLSDLVAQASTTRSLSDAASRNSLSKFQVTVTKVLGSFASPSVEPEEQDRELSPATAASGTRETTPTSMTSRQGSARQSLSVLEEETEIVNADADIDVEMEDEESTIVQRAGKQRRLPSRQSVATLASADNSTLLDDLLEEDDEL